MKEALIALRLQIMAIDPLSPHIKAINKYLASGYNTTGSKVYCTDKLLFDSAIPGGVGPHSISARDILVSAISNGVISADWSAIATLPGATLFCYGLYVESLNSTSAPSLLMSPSFLLPPLPPFVATIAYYPQIGDFEVLKYVATSWAHIGLGWLGPATYRGWIVIIVP